MPENIKLPDSDDPNCPVVHNVGASQGYVGISVKRGWYHDPVLQRITPACITHWQLSNDELGRLLMGAPLIIDLAGAQQTPILITIGDVPEPSEAPTILYPESRSKHWDDHE